MTRKEQIAELIRHKKEVQNDFGWNTTLLSSLDAAINALEQEPCEDAIDRRALRAQFNHLDEVYEGMSEEEKCEAYIYGQIIRAIDDAPSVTPLKSTEGLIKRVERLHTQQSIDGQDMYQAYDVLRTIKEYCSTEKEVADEI